MNIYVVCAIVGGLATIAFWRGWHRTGVITLVLFGVMLALTAIGPNLQHGITIGVNNAIDTAKAFFN
jgi:hypothetical protein